MIKVTVQKNLIGLEDLLVGVGTASQSRGPTGTAAVTITKINGANFPYDAEYTMAEKFDALQLQLDMLPDVIDEDGHMLAGYILTSELDLNLTSPVARIWNKEISSSVGEIYYGDILLFQYHPTDGNLIIPENSDYIAADAVVTAAFEAADEALQDEIDDLFTSTEAIHDLDVGTSANNLVQLDGTGKLPAVDGSLLTGLAVPGGVPIGTIIMVPYATPDSGWAKCNGSAISRTTYAALFAKISTTYGIGDGSTTFNLPELRGEFPRSWDDGRGIDTSRALGSSQTDALKSHNHSIPATDGGTASTYTTVTEGRASSSGSVNTNSTGASETRPRNIALNFLIKIE